MLANDLKLKLNKPNQNQKHLFILNFTLFSLFLERDDSKIT